MPNKFAFAISGIIFSGLHALLLALIWQSFATASPIVRPNLSRGDNAIFHNFGYDRINTFNGNLRIDTLISQDYPLSARFAYQLKLSYNSNAWDLSRNEAATVVSAQPMAASNSGMGWDLSFGRLIPPDGEGNTLQCWIYGRQTTQGGELAQSCAPA